MKNFYASYIYYYSSRKHVIELYENYDYYQGLYGDIMYHGENTRKEAVIDILKNYMTKKQTTLLKDMMTRKQRGIVSPSGDWFRL